MKQETVYKIFCITALTIIIAGFIAFGLAVNSPLFPHLTIK